MFTSGDQLKSKKWDVEFDEGAHARARLGFILMSTDLAAEDDLYAMRPQGVGIHITRLKTEDYTTNETLARHIDTMADAASRLQPDMKPEVICYSCTSGSIVNGEEPVMAEIKKGAPYTQPTTLVTGVVEALRKLNAKKIVVGTPYLDEINLAEAEFLTNKGFQLLDLQGLNLETGIEFGTVTADFWYKFACKIDQPEADAVFLSCGGIRSAQVIDRIEQTIQKPVVTSNQAMFWHCLRKVGIQDKLKGYGQLFDL
ncbi:maleate cis-trans isomerase family protein [Curvivirga sp.]|uniref:maleate cis-trans isomerase family protein n=1 Tax=Curvivirga sp. TaxID=2856848 RepID=UPI003B5921F4